MPYSPAPSFVQVQPADLGALTNASYRTWGLGAAATPFIITPQVTGRLLVVVTGDAVIGTAGSTVTVQLRQGINTAAAHDAADSGTALGGQLIAILLTGALTNPFSLVAIVSGLAVPSANSQGQTTAATPVWLDVSVKVSAGTVQLTNLDCAAVEL